MFTFRLSEGQWAAVGRVAAVISALAAVVAISWNGLQLVSWFGRATLVGAIATDRYVLSPTSRRIIEHGVDSKPLLKLIDESAKKGENPKGTIQRIRSALDKQPSELEKKLRLFETTGIGATVSYIEIYNRSSLPATNVRVLLSGEGEATISSDKYDLKPETVEWKDEIPLGHVKPGGSFLLRVWPRSESIVPDLNPVLVYDGGSAPIQQTVKFYGWDAELVAKYFTSNYPQRRSITIVVVIVCSLTLLSAGYAVGRRRRPTVTPSPAEVYPDTDESAEV